MHRFEIAAGSGIFYTESGCDDEGRSIMAGRKLSEIAKTIRSKNAGIDKITFDVIFAARTDYELVRRSGVLSRAAVCQIFCIPQSRITDYVEFDPALAIKFTILRSISSGSPGDADIFGSQQYGPLLDIAVPTE